MRAVHRSAALALGLAACSIPDTAFRVTAPDDGGAGDAPSAALSIVASTTAIAVDEGAMKDFTVALSQAPSAPLTVTLASSAMTKLGLSVQALSFTRDNFAQPQTVTLTGLTDPDTVDEHIDVALRAAGVDPVTVSATVHDLDRVLQLREISGQSRAGGSTWQSLARGTGSVEADYLNGEIVLLARRLAAPRDAPAAGALLGRRAAARGDAPGTADPNLFLAEL